MLYITAVHLTDGEAEANITSVRWLNSDEGVSNTSTVAVMVEWLDNGHAASVGGPKGPIRVGVVHPKVGAPYLRTHANREWTDNLRQLPRY